MLSITKRRVQVHVFIYNHVQIYKPGAEVSKGRKLEAKESLCLENVRRAASLCDAQTNVFLV